MTGLSPGEQTAARMQLGRSYRHRARGRGRGRGS
jgi:hypothetical protein